MNTKNRVVRVTDELWLAARAEAEKQGETVSDVIRRALATYIKGGAVVALAAVAAFTLSACGSSPDAATDTPATHAAPVVQTQAPQASATVEPQAEPSETPSCWSASSSTWIADYNALTKDLDAALAVLEALPDAHFGCTGSDVAELDKAHDLATEIRDSLQN